MNKITSVVFDECDEIKVVYGGLWQYNYGQILRIEGLDLPSAVEIHFSLEETGGEAKRRIGITKSGVTDVVIPDFILEGNDATRDYNAYAFIYLSDEESGETTHKIKIRVTSRPKPEGHKGTGGTDFAEIMDAVNKIAEQSGQGVSDEKIQEAVNAYLEENPIEETDPTVSDWAKAKTKPNYTASEVGALPVGTKIPSKTSDLTNDSGFLTSHQDLSGYAKKEEIPTKASDIGAEASGTATTKVSEHNVSEESHSDIRLLITNLSNLVTSLLDSDDETLNQTSEIVTYIKSNKSLIDAITTSKVSVSDIVDNLTTSVSDKPVSAKQAVVLKGLIDAVQAELNKIVIPTALPNPHKLIFQGAVTAEYDGSGAVTVTIPTSDGGSVTERIEKLSTDTEVELQPNKLYIFPEMDTLTYTLAEISDNSVLNEYHFVFQSGATATEVVHPESVNIGSFAVEANKIYEISIAEGLLASLSWAVS